MPDTSRGGRPPSVQPPLQLVGAAGSPPTAWPGSWRVAKYPPNISRMAVQFPLASFELDFIVCATLRCMLNTHWVNCSVAIAIRARYRIKTILHRWQRGLVNMKATSKGDSYCPHVAATRTTLPSFPSPADSFTWQCVTCWPTLTHLFSFCLIVVVNSESTKQGPYVHQTAKHNILHTVD